MDSSGYQEFARDIQTITDDKLLQWWDVVTNMMGVTSETTCEWNRIFKVQIRELYDEMIGEAITKRNNMLTKIEQLLEKCSALCKELNIVLPHYADEGLTLYEVQDFLQNKVNEYEETLESVRKEIKKMNKEEASLCNCLGHQSRPLPLQPIPDSDTIAQFKNYLEQLESKKFERDEQFLNIKHEIVQLVVELKYEPSLDFERTVLSSDDSLFMVTDSNMKKLNQFLQSLKHLYDETKEKILNLHEKLNSLWDLLNEDLLLRDSFLKKHTGNNMETLTALQDEVKRCENLKKANIELFVERLRKELVNLWDMCHVSEKDRDKFIYFKSDTYSEDLLSIHDLEITKMKEYYKSNCDLFKLLEKRSELWSRMLHLEESTAMPSRFKNRGGQLLKEEKERNALAKRLPKIEEQLLHLAETFQTRHGKPFCSWGKPIEEVIEQTHLAREEDKKLKLSVRKQKRDQTPSKVTIGMTSSVSVQNLNAITPKSGVKRKLLTPSGGSNAKVLCEFNKNVTRTAPSRLVAANGKVLGRSKYSIERSKRIEKCRRISYKLLEKQEKENTEYDMFEQDLGSKEGCRSTLFFGEHQESNNVLAVPLPLTPNQYGSIKKHTAVNTPNRGEHSKFSTAPGLHDLF